MRYAVITDIHANYLALKAVVESMYLEHDPELKLWFLGDLVGYGPAKDAVRCIDWLRFDSQLDQRWVPGNHDEWIINTLGKQAKDADVTLYHQRALMQRPRNLDNWEWFVKEVEAAIGDGASLNEPRSLVIETFPADKSPAQLALAFTHASVSQISRRSNYLYPWQPNLLCSDLRSLTEIVQAETTCLIYGHIHYPVFGTLGDDDKMHYHSIRYGKPMKLGKGRVAICPGSVGQPRDGDARAAYVILDTEAQTVEFRRVQYPLAEALTRLQDSGQDPFLPDYLAENKAPLTYLEGEKEVTFKDYTELAQAAYDSLYRRLENADGSHHLQEYQQKVYRKPKWDLEAIEK